MRRGGADALPVQVVARHHPPSTIDEDPRRAGAPPAPALRVMAAMHDLSFKTLPDGATRPVRRGEARDGPARAVPPLALAGLAVALLAPSFPEVQRWLGLPAAVALTT